MPVCPAVWKLRAALESPELPGWNCGRRPPLATLRDLQVWLVAVLVRLSSASGTAELDGSATAPEIEPVSPWP
jgi:hypothetical protein